MCTDPKKAFQIGITKNGKPSYLICDKEVHHLEKNHKGYYDKIYDTKISPGCEGAITDYIEVPCGSCKSCRLQHSKTWADRCLLEMQYHSSNLFITLTYDDEHLPRVNCPEIRNGEKVDCFHGSLRKKDLQDFMKRLRYYYPDISYFACGEYGSPENTMRPHYHLIVFGLELNDLVPLYKSDLGNEYCTSESLNKIWTNGLSSVSVANYENAAYTARYVMKKADKNDMSALYQTLGIEPEFVTMSRRPAIGLRWFEDHQEDLYKNLDISIGTDKGQKKIFRNRYFDKRMDMINPTLLKMVKDKAIYFAEEKRKMQLAQTSLTNNELFGVEADNIESRLNGLIRKEI